jgi:hypothetical protein
MSDRGTGTNAAFTAPPHLTDPSRTLVVWFTEPPGIVVQFARPARFEMSHAQWMVGPMLSALLKRFSREEPLAFVLDLSLMDGRDPSVRPLLVEAARKVTHRSRRSILVPPVNANRVYLAGVNAAASLARVFGLTVSIETLSQSILTLRAAPP